jgi:hypothetical protein
MKKKPRDAVYAVAAKVAADSLSFADQLPADMPDELRAPKINGFLHTRLVNEARAYGRRLESIVMELIGREKRKSK